MATPWRLAAIGVSVASSALEVLAVNLPQRYRQVDSFQGSDFFDHFLFWTDDDPSNGAVRYVSREEAEEAGLIDTSDGIPRMGADKTPQEEDSGDRRSVRIQSKSVYNAGLFVARVNHAPSGCGQWPALWLYGEDAEHPWPEWGEYDIAEGVHTQSHARTTLHTKNGCKQDSLIPGVDFTGYWEDGATVVGGAVDCDVSADGQYENEGCSQKGPPGSLGADFNRNGGGIFAAEWDPENGHIRTWFWPSGLEPQDLMHQEWHDGPKPNGWGKPFSYFSLDPNVCDAGHFKNMRLVININLCGDNGDGRWEESCPEEAAQFTCSEYIQQFPESLNEAYWAITGIDVFQRVEDHGQMPPAKPAPGAVIAQTLNSHEGQSNFPKNLSLILGVLVAFCGISGCVLVVVAEFQRQRAEAAYEDNQHDQLRQRQFAMMMAESEREPPENCSLTPNSSILRLALRMFSRQTTGRGDEACCGCTTGIDVTQPVLSTPRPSDVVGVGTPPGSPRQVARWDWEDSGRPHAINSGPRPAAIRSLPIAIKSGPQP